MLNVLDFGCGPGRNIVKYNKRFNRIDGVDIAKEFFSCLEGRCSYNYSNGIWRKFPLFSRYTIYL